MQKPIGFLFRVTLTALLAFLLAPGPASAAPGPLCYVDEFASGAADGSSWIDAYTDLQDALADTNCSEIWVADGTYTPDGSNPGDRSLSFNLKNGVEIYGGFAGTEAARSERDWQANETILSGAIGAATNTDNSQHVVVGSGTDATAVLDGFTIRDGYADAGSTETGGGMYINAGSPALGNLLFTANTAQANGGGLYIADGSPAMTRLAFIGNGATTGAGMAATNSNFQLTETIFRGNTASNHGGGAFISGGSPQLSQVLFESNSAVDTSGALFVAANATLTNVTFYNNSIPSGTNGGAVYLSSDSPVFIHATFSGNTPNALVHAGGSPAFRNSIFWNNSISIAALGSVFTDSIIQGGCPSAFSTCSGILNVDPLLGPLQDNGGFSHTMALDVASPAIDSANSSFCAAIDQRGVARPQLGGCDMGAYEFVPALGPLCYVDADMAWSGDGSSWAQAYKDLQHALANTNCTEIWVAEGTYKPDGAFPGERVWSFALKNGVEIYGGFAGTETLLAERDWGANATILSGEIGSPTDHSDNSIHVVDGSGTNNSAVLDGFTITGGSNASGGSEINHSGAGIFNNAGSPTLRNLFITNNRAAFGGGMANINNSAPLISQVTFYANHASYGAGMSNRSNSAPSVINATFHANQAVAAGAGMYNDGGSVPFLANVTFYANVSQSNGGGMYNTGAHPLINNATFYNNSASIGHSMESTSGSAPLISNSIFWSAHASSEFFAFASSPFIEDSIVKGGCPADTGCSGLIIDADPQLGPLQDNGGFTETLALANTSPAIDVAGSSIHCASDDQRGVARPQHAGCDMGAYEYDGALPPPVPSGPEDEDAGGPEGASKDIASSGLTTLHFGRIWVSVPAGAIPPGQTDCRLTIHPVGDSGEYGFSLDDTVWDVKIICESGELNLFFDALTICIRPADGISGDKNVYHRHGGGGFGAISGGQGPAGYVCGQTRTLSLFTLGQLVLPATGFAPGVVTELAAQDLAYANSGLTLSIPKLGVEMDILGVPQGPNGWDVTWLTSNQAGYLYGTAFPTWKGNSVLTAHVWNADNTPGPFHALRNLQHGDRFTIQAYGYTYTYEVRSNRLVSESNLNVLATSNSQYSQITLITCETFSESSGGYLYRRAVGAVLVAVE